ncbi:uncharacterized protein LOC135349120 isoform X2 [Halichondria panicea]
MSTDVDDEETSIRDDDTTKSPSSVIGGLRYVCAYECAYEQFQVTRVKGVMMITPAASLVVILETFTGLSDDRDAANLVDHVEDECRDVTYFKAISDKKAMECTEDVLMVFFQTVKMCVSRIPKKRASINTVYDQFRDTLTSMTNSPA